MKKNIIGLIAVILATSLSPAAAQESGNAGTSVAPRGAPHAPTPKTADGKPDLAVADSGEGGSVAILLNRLGAK